MSKEMPERIYLHDETDDGDASLLELLWVQHRLEPGDTEYVRADLLTAALKQRDRANEALKQILDTCEKRVANGDPTATELNAVICARAALADAQTGGGEDG